MAEPRNESATDYLPKKCPQCGGNVVKLARLSTVLNDPSTMLLHMKCEVCGHQWPVEKPSWPSI